MARVPAISATDLRAAHEFPGKLMKVTKAGPGVQPHRNQEDRPGHKAGKQSSTAQRLTLHSSVGGAASHGSKLWRCLRHRQRRSSSLVVVRPAGVHSDAASRGRAGAAAVLGSVLRLAKPTEGAPRAGPRDVFPLPHPGSSVWHRFERYGKPAAGDQAQARLGSAHRSPDPI
jgi:hypothetical protein